MVRNRPWWRRGDRDEEEGTRRNHNEQERTMMEREQPWWRRGDHDGEEQTMVEKGGP